MTWSRNPSWVELIVRVSEKVSGSLDPGKNTGKVWRDVRHPETKVLTRLRGYSMRMTSDVHGRADVSGTIRGHNVALVLF